MIKKVADVTVKVPITPAPNTRLGRHLMRAINALIVVLANLAAASVMAADHPPVNAHDVGAASTRLGPIIDGRQRQPTQAEITAWEEAEGQSSISIDRQSQRENREVDDLYREIMRMSATTSPR